MLATQPFLKTIRALQMSSASPVMLTPVASILATFALGQLQHDVDVVDHHVQHDADVDAAEGHGADACDLDESRLNLEARHCPDRGVESFDMTHLYGNTGRDGAIDDPPALGDVLGEGFFDEAGNAAVETPDGRVGMTGGRDGDGRGTDFIRQFVDPRKHPAVKIISDGAGSIRVGVANPQQFTCGISE